MSEVAVEFTDDQLQAMQKNDTSVVQSLATDVLRFRKWLRRWRASAEIVEQEHGGDGLFAALVPLVEMDAALREVDPDEIDPSERRVR